MRVAALALVLIVASAVVLIFANTLNSWVLGGLIGGLAALLISIPISLIIFATLARRHDERLYAQMQLQQEELAHYEEDQQGYEEDDYYDEEDEFGRVYEAEAYYLPEDQEEFELPRGRGQSEIRSLPAAGQSYASSSMRSNAKQRAVNSPQDAPSTQASRKTTRDFAYERDRGERAPDFSTPRQKQNQQTGHQRTERSPYTTRSLRSQQQAAARRVARQEAVQGSSRSEQLSTGPVRRPATTRHLPPQSIQLGRSQAEALRKNAADESRTRMDSNRGPRRPSNTGNTRPQETQTDQLRGRNSYPATGPMGSHPETGQIVRNRQMDKQSSGDEPTTGNLYNPLVRRAPYLYEDDPLSEEFLQQIDKPITRRASRHLSFNEE